MVKYRLRLTEPALLRILQGESSVRLRKVAVAVCKFALEKSGLESPTVSEAMSLLEAGRGVPRRLRSDLEDLVERLDEEYFDAREAAEAAGQDEETWHARFHRARAAAAVLFASEEDPLFAAAEASDEARVASHDDTVGLRQVIEAALS